MKHRHERLEEVLREELAEIIQREVKDPRIPPILNVTRVSMAPDMQLAKVYVTQFPEDDEAIEQTIEGLANAAGFLRSELAHRIDIRRMPELRFYYDESERSQRRVEELLREAKRQTEGVRQDIQDKQD